jgi:hypothetical protein
VEQAASGAAEQGVGIGDDGDHHRRSACEDLAVQVRAELSKRAAAACLFTAVPSEHGGFQHAALVADLLVQGDVSRFNARHDVRARHPDQVCRLLGAEDRVCARGRRVKCARRTRNRRNTRNGQAGGVTMSVCLPVQAGCGCRDFRGADQTFGMPLRRTRGVPRVRVDPLSKARRAHRCRVRASELRLNRVGDVKIFENVLMPMERAGAAR